MAAFVLVRADSLRVGATPHTLDVNHAPIVVPAHEIDRFRRKYYKLICEFDRDHACEVAAKVAGTYPLHGPAPHNHRPNCHHHVPIANTISLQKEVMSAGSTHGAAHAEESLLIKCYNINNLWTHVELDSILIDIEPCYGGRYPGHLCLDFFRPVGRQIAILGAGAHGAALFVNFRFFPKRSHPFTPIIYFQDQPALKEQARARAWKTGKASDYLDEKLYKLGPPPGTNFYTNIKTTTK
jgi:hypothetical protein